MKNLFKRLMNFLLVTTLIIGFFFEMGNKITYLTEWVIGLICFLGFVAGINYVLFGKFRIWNKVEVSNNI